MLDLEATQRAAVVAEARAFVGTRYHHMGRVKAARDAAGRITEPGGVDCAQLLALVYHAALPERVPLIPLEYYPPDWHLHRGLERYLGHVVRHARETEDPKPGDVVLYRWGRCYAHGAIIVDPAWPAVIHALVDAGRVILDRGDGGRLAERPRKFFTLW